MESELARTLEELKKLKDDARKAKNSADEAVKKLTDVSVPKELHKSRKRFLGRLRDFIKHQAKKIKVLDKAIEAARKRKKEGGADDAVKWALAQVGTTESPYGSNWGHPVQDWIQWLGYSSPVPWCGCFAGNAVIKHGGANIPNRIRLGFTPYICQDATNKTNGLTKVAVQDVKKGDLVVFNFGSGEAKHVGVAVAGYQNGSVITCDGNTSSDAGGSQDNGGTVAKRMRPASYVICVARPNY